MHFGCGTRASVFGAGEILWPKEKEWNFLNLINRKLLSIFHKRGVLVNSTCLHFCCRDEPEPDSFRRFLSCPFIIGRPVKFALRTYSLPQSP